MLVGWASASPTRVVLRFGQGAEILTWGINYMLMALRRACSSRSRPCRAVFQPIARILPSTYAFAALREVLAGEPLPMGDIWLRPHRRGRHVVRRVRVLATWMLRVFRRTGFVTRFS